MGDSKSYHLCLDHSLLLRSHSLSLATHWPRTTSHHLQSTSRARAPTARSPTAAPPNSRPTPPPGDSIANRAAWKTTEFNLQENMSESCGSNGFPNAEGNKQKPSKKRTRLEVEEDPTEALSTTQDYLTTCQQPFKYLTVELKLVKDLVQEHVMPQVKNGERSWLCRSMWYNLSDLYNHEAKKAQFANQVRGVDDILDMAKRVNWCDCPNDTEGKCSCAVVKIPHFNSSATSGSTSSRKRSYDDAFSSLGQQVAQQVNFLVSHGHLTREMADDASVLYSRLIDNGLIIVVQRFCNMDDIKEKVALIEWHMVKFKDYM